MRKRNAIFLLLLILAFQAGCRSSRDESSQPDRLQRDLVSGHHDCMYRAMLFLTKHGGPAMPELEVLDDKEATAKEAFRFAVWYTQQEENQERLRAYDARVKVWSPYYGD